MSRFVLSAVLIVVTMVLLDWVESTRSRIAHARRQRRGLRGTGSAVQRTRRIPTGRANTTRRTA